MDHYKLFIDGQFVEAANGATFETIDPGTGLPFATVAQAGPADAQAAIAAARRAFDKGPWSRMTPVDRAAKIYDFADQVAQQTLRLAITEAMDAGHTIKLSKYWGMLGSQILRNYAYTAAHDFPWRKRFLMQGTLLHRAVISFVASHSESVSGLSPGIFRRAWPFGKSPRRSLWEIRSC